MSARAVLLVGALTLAALAAAPAARAQKTVGFAPLVLRLPASARALAMGNAFVAGRGSEMIFYNPAQLSSTPGLGVSVGRFGSASTAAARSASSALGAGGIGLGAQMLDYGATSGATPRVGSALTTRGPEASASLAASLGAAYPFRGIRWGFAVKYAQERFPTSRGSRAAFDVGVAKDAGPVTLAVAAQNLGGGFRVGSSLLRLPRAVTAGFFGGALPMGAFDLTAGASVSVRQGGRVTPAAGAELGYIPLDGWSVVGRVGVRRAEESGPGIVTLGGGLGLDRLSLDYAYEAFDGPGGAHRVGIRIR
ncbi:MAG: hypothetical protein WKG32_05985 [Gemmatimonadaceae bacterium]